MARLRHRAAVAAAAALFSCASASAASGSVDYGPISHKGSKKLGAASKSLQLDLQLGLVANNSGLQKTVKAASDPTSSSYGKYLSLSQLASTYGASKSKRQAVVNAFKAQNVKATVDVTHLRASATITVGKAQKMFGTKWAVYEATSTGSRVALPTDTPKLPTSMKGDVDTIAGMRHQLGGSASAAGVPRDPARSRTAFAGGTPTRSGTPDLGCTPSSFPAAARSTEGLFPNQILTAYGIAPLQASGLRGQGVRVAIVGEAPTPASDVDTFRSCFGAGGTALSIHHAGSIKPILESSLDAMVVSMVAPKLSRFDLWVHSLSEEDDDGDVEGFLALLAQPLQATTNGTPLPHVISVSYGVCEATVKPYTAARKLVERQLAAEAALGITVVVAAGDSGSSACARGVPANQLTPADEQPQVSWPASSPWVLAVGGTSLTLDAANGIASTGVWNDTAFPPPYQSAAGGGGGSSTIVSRPWWQPAQPFGTSGKRMVPDIAAFADESPGYAIVCSSGVQGCNGSGQTIAFVGGTSAATPLVAGMIALWTQAAKAKGLPRPGFVPPLLYRLAQRSPSAFVDVTTGSNAIFGGSCCPARPGYDTATGWGSPLANAVASLLG